MKDVLLGKESLIPEKYDASVLSPISRLDSRIKGGLEDFVKNFEGKDYWTSYETSWLNEQGIPRNKIEVEMTTKILKGQLATDRS